MYFYNFISRILKQIFISIIYFNTRTKTVLINKVKNHTLNQHLLFF